MGNENTNAVPESSSLVNLKTKIEAKQSNTNKVIPTESAPDIKGDDLMIRASGYSSINDQDTYALNLFKQSMGMVRDRMSQDENYAKKVLPELREFTKDPKKLYERVVDEADQIKLQSLRAENPAWFNGPTAAAYGFFNSATFNQLSRISGKAGELVGDAPFEDVMESTAERIRLLSKAYPASNIAGKALSYMVPYSPAKFLLGKSLSTAEKITEYSSKLIDKLGRNPQLLKQVLNSATGAGIAGASEGFITGTLGSDSNPMSLDRGIEESITKGGGAFVFGAAVPVVGYGVLQGVRTGTKAVGAVVEKLSGAPEQALRIYSQNPKAVRAALGTEDEIGRTLVDKLIDSRRVGLREIKQADQLLEQLPDVDPSGMINFLKNFKGKTNPKYDSDIAALKEFGARLEARFAPHMKNGKVPAKILREEIKDIQGYLEDSFGKETSNLYKAALKLAQRQGRVELVNTALKEGGEVGQIYSDLMEKGAKKVGVLKFVSKALGKTPESQYANAERFVRNLFGPNKTVMQQRIKQLDQIFETNFGEVSDLYLRSQQANAAKQLGPNGAPQLLPAQNTGRSLLGAYAGSKIGGFVGSLVDPALGQVGEYAGGVAGGVASSPAVGRYVIGASDKLAKFSEVLLSSPRILGDLAKGRAGEGVRVPGEVKELAGQVYNTLKKEGPLSAGSTLRVIADTPYFLGLAHYFEIANRKASATAGVKAVANEVRRKETDLAIKPGGN